MARKKRENLNPLTVYKRKSHAARMLRARYAKMTDEERSEQARKLVQIRWDKYYAEKNKNKQNI